MILSSSLGKQSSRLISRSAPAWILHSAPSRMLVPTTGRRYLLSVAVNRRLESMRKRHEEIMNEMENADAFTLGKELASLNHPVSLHQKRVDLDEEEISIQELLEEATKMNDKDMKEECIQTLEQLKVDRVELENKILYAILPKDEDDIASDAILEIRAGTGGDEASIFASELL
jgi:peptide chain release factor 1